MMGHTLTESEARAQVAAADAAYMTGADALDVQDDLDARVAEANATHTQKTNEQLHTVNTVTNHASGLKSYSGGNVVAPAHPLDNDDFQKIVRTALDADALFDKAGEVHDFVDAGDMEPFVDPMVLAEGSKQTGRKLF
jgi:hypothetical protein